jgi:hypothetical protein
MGRLVGSSMVSLGGPWPWLPRALVVAPASFPRPHVPRLLLLPRSTPNVQRSRPQSFVTPASALPTNPLTTNHSPPHSILTTTAHHSPAILAIPSPPRPAHTLPADERPGAARRVKGALPLPHSSVAQPARLCSGTKDAPIRSLSPHTRPSRPLAPTRTHSSSATCAALPPGRDRTSVRGPVRR